MNKVINPLQFKQQVMELLYQPAPSSPDLTQLLPELKEPLSKKYLSILMAIKLALPPYLV